MTEREIVEQAREKGYTIRDAPRLGGAPGIRIGGSKEKYGPDHWMNDANVRLYEFQLIRKEMLERKNK